MGKTGKVKVVSYNGSPYALKFIQDGDIVAMNVGEDTVGIGYASMDQTFRVLLGKPPVDERTPIRIWDESNVDDAGRPRRSARDTEVPVRRILQAVGPGKQEPEPESRRTSTSME